MSGWLSTSYNPSSGDGSFNPSWEESFKTKLPGISSTTPSKPTATDFLKTFTSTLAGGLANRDRNAAQKSLGEVEKSSYGGSSSKGGLTDELTMVHPAAPTVIPGTPGSGGIGGLLTGAASGFMQGAATGMPHMGGIGAIAGGLGGFFG